MFAPTFCCYKPFSSPLSSFITSHRFSSSSIYHTFPSFSLSATGGTCTLTWDDVFRISESETAIEDDPSSYLQGYFHKVQLCNRGSVSSYFITPLLFCLVFLENNEWNKAKLLPLLLHCALFSFDWELWVIINFNHPIVHFCITPLFFYQ